MKTKAITIAALAAFVAMLSLSAFANGTTYEPRHNKKKPAGAFIDDGVWQKNQWVKHESQGQWNKALIDKGSFSGAKGNIGVNVAAGEGNKQVNITTIAVGMGKLAKVIGRGDQVLHDVSFKQSNVDNQAGLSEGAFSNAMGNIGVNLASGASNAQQNILRIASVKPLKDLNCGACDKHEPHLPY